MAILINFFDNVILQAISEEIVPKVSFSRIAISPPGQVTSSRRTKF